MANQITNNDRPSSSSFKHTYSPKVSVKAIDSLFLLNYSDIPPPNSSPTSLSINQHTSIPDDNFEILKDSNIFNFFLYIDIPTIDYYNDELKHNKLSKFNKKFKLNRLKDHILNSFTNNNNKTFWDFLTRYHKTQEKEKLKVNVSILSSGSLRYVETIKYLIESIFINLLNSINLNILSLSFKISATPTTFKWFTTFLNKDLLNKKLISFDIINQLYSSSSSSSSSSSLSSPQQSSYNTTDSLTASPFKDYFTKLTYKFDKIHDSNSSSDNNTIDSITIITNSTGVKALLTILADKPLINFISQESIKELHDIKNVSDSNDNSNNNQPSLKRESSSLLNFQDRLITSNKDKSVRIRSLSINRRTNKAHIFNTQIPTNNLNNNNRLASTVLTTQNNNHHHKHGSPIDTHDSTLTTLPTMNINKLIDHRPASMSVSHSRTPSFSSSNATHSLLSLPSANSLMITPIASPKPCLLQQHQHSSSTSLINYDNTNIHHHNHNHHHHHHHMHSLNKTRSLASNNSFDESIIEYDEDGIDSETGSIKDHMQRYTTNNSNREEFNNQEVVDEDEYDDYDDDDEEEEEEEEENSDDEDGISFHAPSLLSRTSTISEHISPPPPPDTQNNTVKKNRFRSLSLMDPALKRPFVRNLNQNQNQNSTSTSNFANIYVHDGHFIDKNNTNTTTASTKRSRSNTLKNNANMNNSNNSTNGNGLIPPEFYSRISTPMSSRHSSNHSLENLNTPIRMTSPLLANVIPIKVEEHKSGNKFKESAHDMHHSASSTSLFERSLINKSFEEIRKQEKSNIFHKLIEEKNANKLLSTNNKIALNFNSLQDEDIIMSGYTSSQIHLQNQSQHSDMDCSSKSSLSTYISPNSACHSGNGFETDTETITIKAPQNESSSTTNSALSSSKIIKKIDSFDIYGDEYNNGAMFNQMSNSTVKNEPAIKNNAPKQNYKKAISIDLYGDDGEGTNPDNLGDWMLGGNTR
ncbi:Snd1p NDAI_0B05480 [Naumovozyma dairenensis CBS 421]|uniref:Uncharacterized protein n=1 Tax=Naumovozyma dairenensis (strain ATCC 10597 / BCRC 20456 / CBS 421 / NBRC 0211 / NRRL Y-12639) TaxID=1071378 RepID=G0W720_NAUDC|nr:hypothetical protein NDAI_0B05480 [Naumovozyma dairenensis CBS 421]CCD23581.1 hypothetical protein NDAI_0B05480 [Naumovozyma dairenensis CBS 421]